MSRFALALLSLLLLAATPLPSRAADQQGDESHNHADNAQASPTATATQLQPSASPKPCGADNQAQNWHKWFWPPVWSSWVLIFVAACAGCIAIRQINKADEALRLDQRPWIVPTGDLHIGFLKERGIIPRAAIHGFPICVYLKNTGKTPALDLKIWMNCNAVDCDKLQPITPEYWLDEKPAIVGAIGPGVVHGQWGGSGRPFNDAVHEGLATGAKLFAIWGTVEYRDHFGHAHSTKFFVAKLGPSADAPTAVVGPYNDCT